MKTIVVTLVLVFTAVSLNAEKSCPVNYFMTKEDTVFCKKIRNGVYNLVYKTYDGAKKKISKNVVLKYTINGNIYEKMPVFENNLPSGAETFMKLICYARGLKVYECKRFDRLSGDLVTELYVFKDGRYLLRANEKNWENIRNFLTFKTLG